MRNDQININQLLDKYTNGEITSAERHLLEKEALDDQFLFDAIEGFSKALEEKTKRSSTRYPIGSSSCDDTSIGTTGL